MKRMNYLLPQGYDTRVTRLDRVALGMQAASNAAQNLPRTGPIVANDIPFALVGNAPSYNVATANPYRKGMILQNKDPTNNLFYRFGGPADANCLFVAPLGSLLLDFTCPTSSVWVFATVNVNGGYVDMSQQSE